MTEELKQRAEENFKKKPLGYESKPELDIYTDGYIDGATENSIKIHNLRENPDDLPKNENTVLVLMWGTTYLGYFGRSRDVLGRKEWHFDNFKADADEPSEWCEIPFKE